MTGQVNPFEDDDEDHDTSFKEKSTQAIKDNR